MNHRIWAGILVLTGVGAAAYASCCKYNLTFTGGNDSIGCSTKGGFVKFCEDSSAGCSQPANGDTDYSCHKGIEGSRKKQCCTFTGTIGFDVCHCSCTVSPGAGWILLGQTGSGTCCWVKNVTTSCTDQTDSTNLCEGDCPKGGGGGVS